MRFLQRLRRIARVLETEPPYDPRQNLAPEALSLANKVLAEMAEEEPKPLPAELDEWFEEEIRPRLLSWLVYEARQRDWAAEAKAAFRSRQYLRTQARLGSFPVDSPVFSGKVREFVLRLLGLDEEAPAAA
jgi:hypothetical protein